MQNYEFKLTPAYCLYNGIAVKKQEGSKICFLAENPDNSLVRERVTKAFKHYLDYVTSQEDCPQSFKGKPAVQFVAGNRSELKEEVCHLYSQTGEMQPVKESQFDSKEEEAAAVLLLDTLLADARKRMATDIHIEKNCVKFRILGKLEIAARLSEDKCKELIQRIKFLAGMNVLEKKRSQDGHFVYDKAFPLFVRVSTVGIVGSRAEETEESLVLRLLDTQRLPLSLEKLGFSKNQLSVIDRIKQQQNGLIIICGPTGAGKSTTAASLLLEIKNARNNAIKIVSLEDPPEYLIPGVTQIQIDEKMNNSFSQALTHVFRQDPDVLMIGEIRDENSGMVAIRAALTGHLVIATLHTDSASGAILRLMDLGVPVNLIVSVLKGVIAQELNNFHENISLVADLAIPGNKLECLINKSLSESEIENLFEHTTNYVEVLNKTLQLLKEKHTLSWEAGAKAIREKRKNLRPTALITKKEKRLSREAAG